MEGALPAIVRENALVVTAPALSMTWTVKPESPDPVGVPLMTPAALSDRPAGSAGTEMDHANGDVPPDVAKVVLYATPCVPPGSGLAVEIESVGLIRIDSAFVAVAPLASVTCTVKLNGPAAEGVPLNAPPELKVTPVGKAGTETLQLSGAVPPVAAKAGAT